MAAEVPSSRVARAFGTEHVAVSVSATRPVGEAALSAGVGEELSDAVLIEQGAEARVYRTTFNGQPAILKERFAKTWRHPDLDARLTRSRGQQEARALQRCRRAGVGVPVVLDVRPERRQLVMEFVEAPMVKSVLWDQAATLQQSSRNGDVAMVDAENGFSMKTPPSFIDSLSELIGTTIAKLHGADIIHGDLTTSNMLLRDEKEIILIDFGLSFTSTLVEDKAVDLYVLERAFLSTHPNTEYVFQTLLEHYGNCGDNSRAVLKRLEDVRQRGRKKLAFG